MNDFKLIEEKEQYLEKFKELPDEAILREWSLCYNDPVYFTQEYVRIHSAVDSKWIPFELWDIQKLILRGIHENRLNIMLKSRQVGATWFSLAYALWLAIFRPNSNILMFSKTDDDAKNLLRERFKIMYHFLPFFFKAKGIEIDNDHEFKLSNGSFVKSFPTTRGDSYTATLVIIDEADLIENYNKLMSSVEPTISTGGKMVQLSRPDKDTPNSGFKNTFRAAYKGKSEWTAYFIPWDAAPNRDKEWYEKERNNIVQRTGSMDDVYEQYPASIEEALQTRSLNRRISKALLDKVYTPKEPLPVDDLLAYLKKFYETEIHKLFGEFEQDKYQLYKDEIEDSLTHYFRVYSIPKEKDDLFWGVDTAEGTKNGDFSTIYILNGRTLETVAVFENRVEIIVFALCIGIIDLFYSSQKIYSHALPENNNHGHALIKDLFNYTKIDILTDTKNKREKTVDYGFTTTGVSKIEIYKYLVEIISELNIIIYDEPTYLQLAAIEAHSLKAPANDYDDLAIAICLAVRAHYIGSGILFA